MKKNIYIFTRCIWTFINFRYELVNKIDQKKYNVHVCMDFDGHKKKDLELKYKGIQFFDIKFLNSNDEFFKNLRIIFQIFNIFLNNKVHIAHNFTARPIVFVTLVSFIFFSTKIINTITGLGNNFFQNKNLFLVIYNIIFLKSKKVIFQNNMDRKIIFPLLSRFIESQIIYPTIKFKKKVELKKTKKIIIFLMHSRMIKQKGVLEYIKAAQNVKLKFKDKCIFYLIGDPDKNNPSSISKKFLNSLKYKRNQKINYISHKKNIFLYIQKSDVIVLPSYGEGMPASLLEALFLKKAIITTNVNGCSELVKNNYNGFLVEAKNVSQIQNAFIKILKNPNLVNTFKKNSYKLFNKKFKKDSIKKYLKIYSLI